MQKDEALPVETTGRKSTGNDVAVKLQGPLKTVGLSLNFSMAQRYKVGDTCVVWVVLHAYNVKCFETKVYKHNPIVECDLPWWPVG